MMNALERVINTIVYFDPDTLNDIVLNVEKGTAIQIVFSLSTRQGTVVMKKWETMQITRANWKVAQVMPLSTGKH